MSFILPKWSDVIGKPTTLAGYGITDAYTKTEADSTFAPIAVPWSSIVSTPTSLAGYGILDAYTKTEADLLFLEDVTPFQRCTGDQQDILATTTAQCISVQKGTAASPDTVVNPLIKVSRIIRVDESAITGTGEDQLSAIEAVCVGDDLCQTQPIGIFGGAKTSSTVAGPTAGGNDATGGFFIGKVTGSGTGYGIGLYSEGRRDTDTAKAIGLEIRVANQTATNGTYSSGGASDTTGLWITAGGQTGKKNAAGIQIGLVDSCQFLVGLGFTKIGGVSSVTDTTIRDDTDSTTSIRINGTHTSAIVAGTGSGYNLLGDTTQLFSGSRLEVFGADSNADPLMMVGHTSYTRTYTIFVRSAVGTLRMGLAGATNSLITGTAAGDAVITPSSTKKLILGRSTQVITIDGATNGLSFFAHATATQQTGGAATAAATYGANEQGMLQRVYDMARAYGLMT